MKKVLLFVTLLIGSVSFGQTIMVNDSPYLATQNNSFPFWLDAGSTLSTNPPMNFISVVEYNENEVGDEKNLGYSKVLSITESSVVPDGKVWKVISALQYHLEGCTDETMLNFDPQANVDDGSCEEIVEGCTNEIMFNYNSDANTDDGSCVAVLEGCTDEGACGYDEFANTDDGSCGLQQEFYNCDGSLKIEVGDVGYGGIVFYVDEVEGFALVAYENELGDYYWGCGTNDVFTSSSIGSGFQNTSNITSSCPETAASVAVQVNPNFGFNDWYLPSLEELEVLWQTLWQPENLLANYTNNSYWSSSQANVSSAWFIYFEDGEISNTSKGNQSGVIPIRTINF